MGGQRVIAPLTREDCGGSELNGRQKAIIAGARADGMVEHAQEHEMQALRTRGLMVNGCLSEKGLLVRKKLKGLG